MTTEKPTEKPLTQIQAAVLDFMYQNRHVYLPSTREIMRQFGWKSPNTVTGHLKALEKKGRIRRLPGRARNREVVL